MKLSIMKHKGAPVTFTTVITPEASKIQFKPYANITQIDEMGSGPFTVAQFLRAGSKAMRELLDSLDEDQIRTLTNYLAGCHRHPNSWAKGDFRRFCMIAQELAASRYLGVDLTLQQWTSVD